MLCHDRRIARDQVLFLVLIRAPLPREVDHKPAHLAATADVRHHDSASLSMARSTLTASARYSSTTACASSGNLPSVFA